MNVLTLLPYSLRTQNRSNKEKHYTLSPYSNPHQNPNNYSQHSHHSVSVSVSLFLFLGNAGFDELVMLQRKKIIVKPLMRASRFLARLPDFYSTSRSQSTLSPRSNLPSQFSDSETLDSSEEQLLLLKKKKKNVTDDDSTRPPLQCHSNNTHFCGGRRSLISTLALRTSSSIPSVNYSQQPPISLSELHLLRSNNHHLYSFHRNFFTRPKQIKKLEEADDHSQRAVTTALWCNFLVFSLKFGVWLGTSSHVMLAEVIHSVADFANQALLAYGLSSSKRAPDALHPYGYSKERFVWSLISAVGIFCLGSGATIVHGVQNLWTSQPPENIQYAALVIGGSFLIEGASLVVAIHAVRKGAAAEGMTVRDFVWRGHDPTSVAVMTEDGAAVTGLLIAAASLVAVNTTGNAIYDPIGSIVVGNLLGLVAIFLIQRNRHALIGRAIDDHDMERVLNFLKNDPVVDAIYDCKSEVIGPGFFRFKAEIDFNGVVLVQNYLNRTGRIEWARQFREASNQKDDTALLKIMSNYGEEVVTALGSEVDRLEKEIQDIVPGIRHVDIEAHNPIVPL